MRIARGFGIAPLVLVIAGAILCASRWYETPPVTAFLALTKVLGLAVAALAAFLVFGRQAKGDRNRRPWLSLAAGLALWATAQTILLYYQVVLGVRTPFPSAADPLFVLAAPFIVIALVDFGLLARRSGLSLGSGLGFWSPALIVLALFGATIYFLLAPVVQAGGGQVELFLNIYYPALSFVTLAPLAVMLRVGFKFRGGRLHFVWLTLATGFASVLVADVLFAYLTGLGMTGLLPLVDFLYLAGYLMIPTGILFQHDLLRA